MHAVGRPLAYLGLLQSKLRKSGTPVAASQAPQKIAPVSGAAPAPISGLARKFTAGDAELYAGAWTITKNGRPDADTPQVATRGQLLYLYLPGEGRYIFSLVPRVQLGFTRAGQVNPNLLQWTSDGLTYVAQSATPIIPTGGPFYIYMLHDPAWQPVSMTQRGRPSLGSVSPEELQLLQQKDNGK